MLPLTSTLSVHAVQTELARGARPRISAHQGCPPPDQFSPGVLAPGTVLARGARLWISARRGARPRISALTCPQPALTLQQPAAQSSSPTRCGLVLQQLPGESEASESSAGLALELPEAAPLPLALVAEPMWQAEGALQWSHSSFITESRAVVYTTPYPPPLVTLALDE